LDERFGAFLLKLSRQRVGIDSHSAKFLEQIGTIIPAVGGVARK
jgi:hypothetical protein